MKVAEDGQRGGTASGVGVLETEGSFRRERVIILWLSKLKLRNPAAGCGNMAVPGDPDKGSFCGGVGTRDCKGRQGSERCRSGDSVDDAFKAFCFTAEK